MCGPIIASLLLLVVLCRRVFGIRGPCLHLNCGHILCMCRAKHLLYFCHGYRGTWSGVCRSGSLRSIFLPCPLAPALLDCMCVCVYVCMCVCVCIWCVCVCLVLLCVLSCVSWQVELGPVAGVSFSNTAQLTNPGDHLNVIWRATPAPGNWLVISHQAIFV